MTQIIVDAALRSRLYDLTQPLEFRDESGRVLARLVPVTSVLPADLPEPPITEEELERRRHEPDYSTKEVLDYLEKL